MKDFDELLQTSTAQPSRELSSNFTDRVVAEIKDRPNQSRKEFFMKLHTRPLVTGVVIIATLILFGGGVTYAATDGFTKPFNLYNIFGYKTIEDGSGKKILAVQTASCTTGTANGTTDNSDQTLYFRLKDKAINESDALRWIQGYCETINSESLYAQFRNEPVSLDDYMSAGVVESFENNILTISQKIDTSSKTSIEKYLVHSDTVIKNSPRATSKMTKGDSVMVISRQNQSNSGTAKPASYILHESSDSEFYNSNFDTYRSALERVKPCNGAFCSYDSISTELDAKSKDAVSFVRSAYEPYKLSLERDQTDWQVVYQDAKQAFASNTTPQLSTKLSETLAVDPILCVQQVVPSKLSYGSPVLQGSIIVVPVLRSYQDTDNTQPKVFADVSYSTILKKITSIDCTERLSN